MQAAIQHARTFSMILIGASVCVVYLVLADVLWDGGVCAGAFQAGMIIPEFCDTQVAKEDQNPNDQKNETIKLSESKQSNDQKSLPRRQAGETANGAGPVPHNDSRSESARNGAGTPTPTVAGAETTDTTPGIVTALTGITNVLTQLTTNLQTYNAPPQGASSYTTLRNDLTELVHRQTDSTYNDFGDSVSAVTENMNVDGSLTLNDITGGVLTANSSGAVSAALLGGDNITNNSLDFSELADDLTLDASTTIDMATNSANLTFGSNLLYIDESSQRIGFGTTSPQAYLDLTQRANGTPMIAARRATDLAPAGDFLNYYDASGTSLFRVDNSGNLLAGGIINTGSQTITATSTPQFRVQYDPSNEWTAQVDSIGATTFAVNGTTPSLSFTPGTNGTSTFRFTDAADTAILTVDTTNQSVGIGTTSPSETLHVAGATRIEGALYDNANSAGATGYVLQSDGSGFNWVATSSLGIATSPWTESGSDITYTTGNVGIGDASPDHLLDVEGNIGIDNGAYLNWGDTSGSGGYGLRDNSGTIEVKNLGGTWIDIGSGDSGTSTASSSASGIGMVSSFPTASCPAGWLQADGSAVSRTTYSQLFDEIGTAYGNGDGSTTFNLPDLRGEFIRGWNDSRGVDSGRSIGTTQGDQNKAHSHTGSTNNDTHSHSGTTNSDGNHRHSYSVADAGSGTDQPEQLGGGSGFTNFLTNYAGNHAHSFSTNNDTHSHSLSINSSGGSETRPRNLALNYCISYRGSVSTGGVFTENGLNAHFTAGDLMVGTSTNANARLTVQGATTTENILNLFSAAGEKVVSVFDSGNVGIGTENPGYLLEVAGSAAKPGGGSWSDSSDRRLKTNIEAVAGALDKVTKLDPVMFDWRNPDLHGGNAAAGGFIAQDVAEVFPQWVGTSTVQGADAALVGADGTAYSLTLPFEFNAYIVGAIKELYAMIVDLKETVAGFATRIVSDEVVAQNQLCVGETCVNETQLKALLAEEGLEPGTPTDPAGTTTASTTSLGDSDQTGQTATSTDHATTTATSTDSATTTQSHTSTTTDQTGQATTTASSSQSQTSTTTDTTPPTLDGVSDTTITVGDSFDAKDGVTAEDDVDGTITTINITGSVDTTAAGTYTLTYTVTDQAGNTAEKERMVTVEEPQTVPDEPMATTTATST